MKTKLKSCRPKQSARLGHRHEEADEFDMIAVQTNRSAASFAERSVLRPDNWDPSERPHDLTEMMKIAWNFMPYRYIWNDPTVTRPSEAQRRGILRRRPNHYLKYTPRWVKPSTWTGLKEYLKPLAAAARDQLWKKVQDHLQEAAAAMVEVQATIKEIILHVQPPNHDMSPLPDDLDDLCNTAWEEVDHKFLDLSWWKVVNSINTMQGIVNKLFVEAMRYRRADKSLAQHAVDDAFSQLAYKKKFANNRENEGIGYAIAMTPKGIMDRIRRRLASFPITLYQFGIERGVRHTDDRFSPDPDTPLDLRPKYQVILANALTYFSDTPMVTAPNDDTLFAWGWTPPVGKQWGGRGRDWSPEQLLRDLKELIATGAWEKVPDLPDKDR
mmetsp:Transcript_54481/g.127258  ORF Transcript_54481/g.127258 Transcript_54481/m.127258 type:complete len:384 (-) Transcript_54481:115-1266(-)